MPCWHMQSKACFHSMRPVLLLVFTTLLAFRFLRAIAFTPDIAWTRHSCGQVIAGTVFAFLLLNGGIIHMHIVLDGGYIIVSQQYLQAERIIAQHEVAHGEGMTQNVRTDAFAGDASPLAKAGEQHLHAIFRERGARLC